VGGQPELLCYHVRHANDNTNNTTAAATAQQSSEVYWARTGVRPNTICGGFPLRKLSSSSSTKSWAMSMCIAWMGMCLASLDPMSLSGAPWRAMPPVGRWVVAMLCCGGLVCSHRSRIWFSRSLAPSWPLRETKHVESTQALCR
jgi:hypothetical protein